jgi:hypothetical protein
MRDQFCRSIDCVAWHLNICWMWNEVILLSMNTPRTVQSDQQRERTQLRKTESIKIPLVKMLAVHLTLSFSSDLCFHSDISLHFDATMITSYNDSWIFFVDYWCLSSGAQEPWYFADEYQQSFICDRRWVSSISDLRGAFCSSSV